MKRVILYLIYGALLLQLVPGLVLAGVIRPDLQTALDGLGPDDEVAVIVTLNDKVNLNKLKGSNKSQRRTKLVKALKDKAEKTQKPVKAFLQQNKAKNLQPFWVFNGLAATVKVGLVEKLTTMDGIESISLDGTLSAEPPADDSAILPVWNLDAIRAPELWVGAITGNGVVVANMDTGVDISSHADLAVSYRGGANSWYDPHGQHPTPYDAIGHGTQVTGIMVGGEASGWPIGVAPGAQWIAVKIFDDSERAQYSDIHSGFQWLLDPDGNENSDDAPDVVNNSWGYPTLLDQCFQEFQADVQALKAAQIGVVFSAGNMGRTSGPTSESPANYSESFAVGSVNSQLLISDFSSRGPSACTDDIYPEVVAPGESIYTTDLGGHYASVYGTSFAAPHIAGAMGLLLSSHPYRSIEDIESALIASAQDKGEFDPDNAYGYGLLDVVGADSWLSLNQPPCTDTDSDGFCAEEFSGTAEDCNDGEVAINPSAIEIKHDGIDQDCNGYDQTIDVTKAQYADNSITVEATSDLGAGAALELAGYGVMNWSKKGGGKWTISVSPVDNPESVVVSGVEGAVQTTLAVAEGGDSGGSKGGGKKKK